MRRIEWADKSGLIALEMVGYPPNIIRQHYCPVKAGKSVFEIVET